MAVASSKTSKFQALVHLSVARLEDAAGIHRGADLVHRGELVDLTPEQAENLKGKVRPAAEADQPFPRLTARDLSGRRFPDQREQGLAATGATNLVTQPAAAPATPVVTPAGEQPEENPPVMMDQGAEANPAKADDDPYAQQDAKR